MNTFDVLDASHYKEFDHLQKHHFPAKHDDIRHWSPVVLKILFTKRRWKFAHDEDFPLLVVSNLFDFTQDDMMKLKPCLLRDLLFHIHQEHKHLFSNPSFSYRYSYFKGKIFLRFSNGSTPEKRPRKKINISRKEVRVQIEKNKRFEQIDPEKVGFRPVRKQLGWGRWEMQKLHCPKPVRARCKKRLFDTIA